MITRPTSKPTIIPNAIIDKPTGKIIVQTPMPPINCIAVEGGGSRCAAFPGFYKVLVKTGAMKEARHCAGSSGGAIFALAAALGFPPEKAEKILIDLNMEQFLEGKHKSLSSSGLFSMAMTAWSIAASNNYGLSSGKKFLEWIEDIVEASLGNKQATFADLAKLVATNPEKYKYLYVTGVDIILGLPECKTFSHETKPDMPLALAVRISASMPTVFQLVPFEGHLWVDGGVKRNLPTKIFDDKRFLPEGFGFTEKGVNPGVLAVKIDSKDEIMQVMWGVAKVRNISTASEFGSALYNAATQTTDSEEIREARLTLALPDNNIGLLEFSVDQDGKINLISSAEIETLNFLENHFNTAYEVNTFPNVIAWLNACSLDELDVIIHRYVDMLAEIERLPASFFDDDGPAAAPLPGNAATASSSSTATMQQSATIDEATQPTKKQIRDYIEFLEKYFEFRVRQRRSPYKESTLTEIPIHISLKTTSEVKTHEDVMAWLNTTSLDELDAIIRSYMDKLAEMERLPTSSADQPTKQHLRAYIAFLENYSKFRVRQRHSAGIEFICINIPMHVNIKPTGMERDWCVAVKQEMQRKLRRIEEQITHLNKRLESIRLSGIEMPDITDQTQLHNPQYFDHVQAITSFTEYRKILVAEVKDLQIKLGVFHSQANAATKENSRASSEFMEVLNPVFNNTAYAQECRGILIEQFPIVKFESSSYESNCFFMLDLYQESDRKLYIIAALYFFENKIGKLKDIFSHLYNKFVSADVPLPKNMQALSAIFGCGGEELLVIAYRIEELLRHFEKSANPKFPLKSNLDTIFGVDKIKTPKPKRPSVVQNGSGIVQEMRHIIKSNSLFKPLKPESGDTQDTTILDNELKFEVSDKKKITKDAPFPETSFKFKSQDDNPDEANMQPGASPDWLFRGSLLQ